MTQKEEENYEPTLRFVELDDDNTTMLLNGESKYFVKLPSNISKKNAADKMRIIKTRILDGCDEFKHDYVSEDNINRCAKEVVDQLYERSRVVKTLTVSDVIRMNEGRVMTTAKIICVSEPDKMIIEEILECPQCGYTEVNEFDPPRNPYKLPPKKCPNKCKIGEIALIVLIAQFDYVNTKIITVQDPEVRDDLEKLRVVLFEDHGRNVRVGETATITGDVHVTSSSGSRGGGGGGSGKKLFAVLYANHIKYEREEEKPITEEDITEFRKFAEQSDTIDQLIGMFAPHVIGHSDAKLGILRSAVSVRENKHLTSIRSRTHTLLAGDPGTAKSMLAEEATKIVPNSRYVTSQHISIKSAMAIIDKEPDGSKMLMLGAVPQARNAICSINEMGSMVYEDQQHLADVLEEGHFTIDKYGIYQEISSPTTVIATTNPHGGYWDRSIAPSLDQLPIKSNIRDRFDQIYIFEDFQTTEERRDYAIKKTEIYQNPEGLKIDYDFLKRYLRYAASIQYPVLTAEAGTMLTDFWMRMTEAGYAANRSLDSLIRMARDQARLHLKEEIDAEIANETMRYVQLMFVKMGMRVDPSVEDPRDLTYHEIIQYVNTLEASITFEEAEKQVCANNKSLKQYLGGTVWSIGANKRLRSVHDRFTDAGGIGKVKVGRGGLAITIMGLSPLTLVKVDRQQQQQQQQKEEVRQEPEETQESKTDRSTRSITANTYVNNDREQSNLKNGSSVIAQFAQFDRPNNSDPKVGLVEVIRRVMLDNQGNNKEYFTLDDFVFAMQMIPNERWTENEAEQTLYALLEEGKIQEIEPGRYSPAI